jgi:glycosyltransferase involved in cell wall biosynthesis
MLAITVLTITYGRREALRCLLESIIKADRFSDIHLLVLINGTDILTEALLNEYAHKYSNIRFTQSVRHTKGKARNILMSQSQGRDVFYFLDDDCQVAQDVFTVLMDVVEANPGIQCFGGPNLTCPGDSIFAQAQGYALGSFFGALWVRDRYRVHGWPRLVDEKSLILCNLVIRCKALDQGGVLFNEALACAEENLLIQDLISLGCQCMHIPYLRVFHERRKTMRAFWGQMFIYGLGKCQVLQKRSFFLWMMKAVLLVACLVSWMFFVPWMRGVLIFFVILYAVSGALTAMRIAARAHSMKILWYLLLIFPGIHTGYGFGFIWGILTVVDNRMFKRDQSRFLPAA